MIDLCFISIVHWGNLTERSSRLDVRWFSCPLERELHALRNRLYRTGITWQEL